MSKRLEHDGVWGGRVAAVGDVSDPCAEIDALLEPYLDDELDPTDQTRVANHVERCTHCAHQLQLTRQVRGGLRALPCPPCPDAVSAAAITHANKSQGQRPTDAHRGWPKHVGRRTWQPLVALAAATALAIGLRWHSDLRPNPPIDPAVAQAKEDIKLALAYLGRMGEQTGTIVRDDVLATRVASPVVRSIREALEGKTTP